MDRRADLAVALVVTLLGAGILLLTGDIRPTGPVVDPIGPRGFPYVIGAILLSAGAILTATRARALLASGPVAEESEGEPDEAGVPASAVQAWSVMAATVIYVLALEPLGYPIATPLFVVAALILMKLHAVTMLAVVAVSYTAVTYIVFAVFMRVMLPLGPLEPWFRAAGLAR